MNNTFVPPTEEQICSMVTETRARAMSHSGYEWDKLAVEWPLTTDSTVVEIGGYCGRWALQIAERYHPHIHVFEPQPWAFEVCKRVLGTQAVVHNFALGTHNGTHNMGQWGTDGCSFFNWDVGDENTGEMREAAPILNSLGNIDLMLMNIEGYEHLLLPYLLDNLIDLPRFLMVQFHTFNDKDVSSMGFLRKYMLEWYELLWDYGPTLSAWQRKNQ